MLKRLWCSDDFCSDGSVIDGYSSYVVVIYCCCSENSVTDGGCTDRCYSDG